MKVEPPFEVPVDDELLLIGVEEVVLVDEEVVFDDEDVLDDEEDEVYDDDESINNLINYVEKILWN